MERNATSREILEEIILRSEGVDEPYRAVKLVLRYLRPDKSPKTRICADADAVYFYSCDETISAIREKGRRRDLAERGDTMTSFWAPMTWYLGLNDRVVIKKNDENIDKILAALPGDNRTERCFTIMEYLAAHYVSRGNLLLLPNTRNKANQRKLNPDRFRVSEDKLDQFLLACLKGELLPYFCDKPSHAVEWILRERLECMFFKDFFSHSLKEIEAGTVRLNVGKETICPENLQSLINQPDRIESYSYRAMTDEEWEIYFDRLNKVIAYRNAVGIESHEPLCWD